MAEANKRNTGEANAASNGKITVNRRKPRSKTGRRATKRAATEAMKQAEVPAMKPEEASSATVDYADAAERLRGAVSKAVSDNADDIAKGLVEQAKAGNPACTKLLLDVMAGKMVAPKKLLRAMTLAQEFHREAEQKGEKQEQGAVDAAPQ